MAHITMPADVRHFFGYPVGVISPDVQWTQLSEAERQEIQLMVDETS